MTETGSAEAHLDRLIDELHEGRLRVWSIVISFFGDAVSPRGGVLWLSAFRPLASRLRIETGTLGAAMSRLTADDWLVREKRGRNTLYRLNVNGQTVFERAARRIYGFDRPPTWDGTWSIAVRPSRLTAEPLKGFVRIDERTWARPNWPEPIPVEPEAATFTGTAETTPALHALVADAWQLDAVAAAYRGWSDRFAPLLKALREGAELTPVSAMSARLLLIHDFRRIVLKDPELPDALRGPDWPGHRARENAAMLYRALLGASERWLDASDATPEGPFPPPNDAFNQRFGGLK